MWGCASSAWTRRQTTHEPSSARDLFVPSALNPIPKAKQDLSRGEHVFLYLLDSDFYRGVQCTHDIWDGVSGWHNMLGSEVAPQ